MERAISDEEKIKRAIEISQRRNNSYYTTRQERVNVNNKKEYRLFKRMILQIIICLLIYLIFYLISTTNNTFSEEVIKTTNSILSYDINVQNLYHGFQQYINTLIPKNINVNENIIENSTISNSIQNKQITSNSTEERNEIKTEAKQETKEISRTSTEEQMRVDAEKVKKLCKFQKPLNGTITSQFGEREVLFDGMTSDHKGIDIAAKSGTNINAAMSGIVSVAEENKEYGKFIKIVNGDIMTVYAHCKELKVKEGDKIKIGKTIATVGSTGNSTGPHLHFEIRLSNRYINPRYVINF